jgi:hypothetical protein
VLFFVSKYILVTGLASPLVNSDRPIVVNTSVPDAKAGAIDFDDLESAQRFSFTRSNAQQWRANELLSILATSDSPALAYITWGPRQLVRTSLAGDVGRTMKIGSVVLGAVADPPAGRAAYRGATQVALVQGSHDVDDARQLAAETAALVSVDRLRHLTAGDQSLDLLVQVVARSFIHTAPRL